MAVPAHFIRQEAAFSLTNFVKTLTKIVKLTPFLRDTMNPIQRQRRHWGAFVQAGTEYAMLVNRKEKQKYLQLSSC
jgi:hypothetical protein